MNRFLVIALTMFGMGSFSMAQTQTHTFLNPGAANGYQYYNFPNQGTIKGNVEYYRGHVLNCNLVYSCQLLDAYDDVSADSDLDGVCKAFGYSTSVGSLSGNVFNPFGQIMVFGANGQVNDMITKRGLPLTRIHDGWSGFPPVMYEAVSQNVLTSITCQ